ncbi:MAG: hemerythrin domain-containing protein [Kofleriaceae bacterium]
MVGSIHQFLSEDHARLDDLLSRASGSKAIDVPAYDAFRAGLLRHIAMEEKVLFADARMRRGEPLPLAKRLHADHATLASLLVPSPTHALLRTMRALLDEHNPLEEGDHGFYATCEELAGGDLAVLLARMQALPPVRVGSHVDEPRIHEHIARMLGSRTKI